MTSSFKMAETDSKQGSVAGTNDKGNKNLNLQQKRKSDVAFDREPPDDVKRFEKDAGENTADTNKGKITMKLGSPVKKSMGITMNIGGPKKAAPIKMTMPSQEKKETPSILPKSAKVASVFNEDSESDEEEMPPEARMRMRNVGRETPTAAGPNSFGKGNLGFCDRNKMIERKLKQQMEEYGDQADTTRDKT